MRKLLYILILLLIVSPTSAVSIIPKQKESYTCVDYSREFQKENPEWGCVTMAHNQWFHGSTHMVNYQLINNNTDMMIHDGMYDSDYTICNWKADEYTFYHFWFNQTPVRNYVIMQDNREKIEIK